MKAYGIKDPKGNLMYLIRFCSKDVKAELISGTTVTWKDLYKKGYRCVAVEITEIKTESNG